MSDTLQLLLAYKTAIVLAVFVLFFAAERFRPAVLAPAGRLWQRLVRNLGLSAINFVLSPLIVVPSAALAAGLAPSWRPEWWSGGYGLLLDLLIMDCAIYWMHRANHTFDFLWRFHRVHHLDEHLDTTSGLRFHFGEVLISAGFRVAFIIATDMPIESVIVFEALLLLASLFHHSNTRLPATVEKAVSLIIVTPSIHRVHHHADPKDLRSNMATVLSVWDRLFGSRSATADSRDLNLGVPGERDLSLPELIVRPVRPPD